MLRLDVDPHSGYPIYLQIVEQVQRSIRLGVLMQGEQLPTIKQIASDLVVNPSTVARALRELEYLRIITTRAGKGSYVATDAGARTRALEAERSIAGAIDRAVREARSLEVEGATLRGYFERAFANWYVPATSEARSNDS